MKLKICIGAICLLMWGGKEAVGQRVYKPTYISEETERLDFTYEQRDLTNGVLSQDTIINYDLVLPEIVYYPGRVTNFYRDVQPPYRHRPQPSIIVPLYRSEDAEEQRPFSLER